MDSQILDITQVHVPRDDGSLSRAIAELEARLSAYSASLRTVHKRVRRTETVKATPVEPVAATESAVAEAVAVSPPVEPAEQQDRSSPPSLAEAEIVKPVIEETPPLTVEAVPPSPESPAESPEENEEALLASLDSVTAERVRVLRRLCDRKKSVHQLLSELESSPPSPPPARTRKRSWFSKG